MNKELKNIINDNSSGSNQILLKLIDYCKKNYRSVEDINLVCKVSREKLLHFASIKNFINELKQKINHSSEKELLRFLIDYETAQIDAASLIYHNHHNTFDKIKSLTTISFSKTVLDIIKLISKRRKNLKVFVLESRPILEGRKLADELIKLNINTTIVVDSLMSYAVKNSDSVVIGADQILKNGNVVNKIGSFALALCAREFNKPIYVVADKSKFVNSSKFVPKKYPNSEVCKTKKKIKIVNHYFEEVPANLITKILSN